MWGVLEGAVRVDQLDAVAGGGWGKGAGDVPGVGASVGGAVDDGEDGEDVGGWALEEDQGDVVLCSWRPGDGEWGAGGHQLAELRVADGIARRVTA